MLSSELWDEMLREMQLLSSYVCLPCQQCCSALKADLVLHKRTIYLPFHATSQSAAQITTCLAKNNIHFINIVTFLKIYLG